MLVFGFELQLELFHTFHFENSVLKIHFQNTGPANAKKKTTIQLKNLF